MKLAEANRRLMEISNNAESGVITPEEAVGLVEDLKEEAGLKAFNPSIDPDDYQPFEPEPEDDYDDYSDYDYDTEDEEDDEDEDE